MKIPLIIAKVSINQSKLLRVLLVSVLSTLLYALLLLMLEVVKILGGKT